MLSRTQGKGFSPLPGEGFKIAAESFGTGVVLAAEITATSRLNREWGVGKMAGFTGSLVLFQKNQLVSASLLNCWRALSLFPSKGS